jgi:hypothetical protein
MTAVTLRLYAHGLGDCLLLSFPKEAGGLWRVLVDCGIHGAAKDGNEKMAVLVEDLAVACDRRLDVIVGTHEHWDHLSGFLACRDRFVDAATPDLADDDPRIRVGEVWMSWGENPADRQGRALDRYKGEAQATILGLRLAMQGVAGTEPARAGIDALSGFLFGLKGERVRAARDSLARIAPVRYLEPGMLAPVPAGVAGVAGYVLGPPRDEALLHLHDDPDDRYRMALGSHPDCQPLATALAMNEGRLSPADDPGAPFDDLEGVPLAPLLEGKWSGDPARAAIERFFWDHYLAPAEGVPWPGDSSVAAARRAEERRIEGQWLMRGAELALQLDRNTNNMSLVLAFELAALDGGVLFLAADAQAGAWASFADVAFTLPDGGFRDGDGLLRKTLFYKVGHHGSGNATPRDKGLEKMDAARLVVFNPTDGALAQRLRWKEFPAPSLERALKDRSSGRYIRSDDSWIGSPDFVPPALSGGALKALRTGRAGQGPASVPWVEVDLG